MNKLLKVMVVIVLLLQIIFIYNHFYYKSNALETALEILYIVVFVGVVIVKFRKIMRIRRKDD